MMCGSTCSPRAQTGARQICRNCATATRLRSRRASSVRTPRPRGISPGWTVADLAIEDGGAHAPTQAAAPGRAGAAGDRPRGRADRTFAADRPPGPGVQPGPAVAVRPHARGQAAAVRPRLADRGDRDAVHVPGAVDSQRIRRAAAY